MSEMKLPPAVAERVRHLLPAPRKVEALGGSLVWPIRAVVACGSWLEPLRPALEELGSCCYEHADSEVRLADAADEPALRIRCTGRPDAESLPPPAVAQQSYTLSVAPEGVVIDADTVVGAAYGVRTLIQLIDLNHGKLPAVVIRDRPDFVVRGLSYDISRGRVPTMEYLYRLVDRLAALKANHLELYTEHTFAFAFDPEISAGCSPMTADEIRELDAYCRARCIELTPSLACFGHMARILSLPQYRHLAEVDAGRPWPELTWRERVRGLTIDASNPESRMLLGRMLDEYLPLFTSPRVNVCCDETFDLAKGRGKVRADEIGVGGLFLEHVLWLREHCDRHGKQIMIWGDMLKHHPEIIERLPRDVTILNWGYGAECDYDSTKLFTEAGLPTWVCPGTSGWNRFVHDINTADLNIRRYAAAGLKYRATGLLNTEWGDDGHVAPPGCALLPISLGAAVGWNARAPSRRVFDAAYARLFLGEGGEPCIARWRAALRASAMPRIWPAFYGPLDAPELPASFDGPALQRWLMAAGAACGGIMNTQERSVLARAELADVSLGMLLHMLAAQRFMRVRGGSARALPGAAVAWALGNKIKDYEQAWLETSRPSGLAEVLAALHRVMDDTGLRQSTPE